VNDVSGIKQTIQVKLAPMTASTKKEHVVCFMTLLNVTSNSHTETKCNPNQLYKGWIQSSGNTAVT